MTEFGHFLEPGKPDQKSFYGKEVDEYSNKSLFSAFPFFVYNKKKEIKKTLSHANNIRMPKSIIPSFRKGKTVPCFLTIKQKVNLKNKRHLLRGLRETIKPQRKIDLNRKFLT
jgi:hypothetical protein